MPTPRTVQIKLSRYRLVDSRVYSPSEVVEVSEPLADLIIAEGAAALVVKPTPVPTPRPTPSSPTTPESKAPAPVQARKVTPTPKPAPAPTPTKPVELPPVPGSIDS